MRGTEILRACPITFMGENEGNETNVAPCCHDQGHRLN
jgi:hypothetical protein